VLDNAQIRIGLGTDCHRLAPNLPLWVGGVHITESSLGCVAHSDGDALVHALIDALLGTVAMGDIGTHFPPSDDRWKDANSLDLLQQTLTMIRQGHPDFSIMNVDAVVHLERPKLGGYRVAIQTTLSEALGIAVDRISLKAKTGEGLPPIGTLEAISTQVIALVNIASVD
jgi:2-C-methyl-D-erythritol 2,4-cyclodiphosphate synthase